VPEDDNPLAAAVLSVFPDAQPVPQDSKPTGTTISGWHQINQPYFRDTAPSVVSQGWSLFPQERDGKRGPGIVDGRMLAWKPYQHRLPTQAEVAWWSAFCPGHNLALLVGPASGHTFALDLDVDDADASDAIQELAEEHLGYTPFRRVGRFPRIVLIYRDAGAVSGAAPDVRIRPRKLPFGGRLGDAGGALEVLGGGAPITAYGLHHKTGKYFIWLDKVPHVHGPDHAPLVSRDQFDAFLDAVNAAFPFSRAAVSGAEMAATWAFDPEAGLHVPAELGAQGGEWTVQGGKVTDGRERFLFRLVSRTVYANESAARDPGPGRANLCALVEQQFLARAEMGGKWSPEHLRSEISAKVAASCARHIELDRFARRIDPGRIVAIDAEGRVEHAPSRDTSDVEPLVVDGLEHLKAHFGRKGAFRGGKLPYTVLAKADPARAAQRAIVTDEAARLEAARAAVRAVEEHEYAFIRDHLYPRAAERRLQERAGKKRIELDAGVIQILKGDAGVGKTRSFWKALARAKAELGPLGYPVGFMAPSHANIEDNLGAAVRDGAAWESRVADVQGEAERHGLKVLVFRGKMRTNCAFKEQIKLLDGANIGADRLCKARVQLPPAEPGGKPLYEEQRCPFWDRCEYQATLAQLATADVVLFASAYLSVTPPAALSKALIGAFVDERPYSGLVRDNSRTPMPLSVLRLPRAAPRLTKEEMAELEEAGRLTKERIEDRREGYRIDRNITVEMIMPFLEKGDLGGMIRHLHEYNWNGQRQGLGFAETALALVSRTDDSAREVVPGMTEEAAAALAGRPAGTDLLAEKKFWSLVVDRLKAMGDDEDEPLDEPRARGTRDHRMQVVMADGEKGPVKAVRMSWRKKPSFDGLPLLMLDASAEPKVIEKVWQGRVVETLPVTAPCHLRTVLVTGSTFSDRSMNPLRSTRADDILDAAEQVQRLRDLITRLAGVHGYGRVLVCLNKSNHPILRGRWDPPKNVDFVWNGAMRGLDFAKGHVAAINIGRMELPIRAIDAQVAALTYDDLDPEAPVDTWGNGLVGPNPKDKPMKSPRGDRRIAMRDGRDIVLPDAVYDGTWAKIVQRQTRDEEVRQFVARLRPVHRLGEPPVAYVLTAAVPDGLIVDDVIDIEDLVSIGAVNAMRPWEAARATGGLIDATQGWADRPDLGGLPDGTLCEHRVSSLKLDVEGAPESRGTMRIRYRIDGGAWRHASIALWHEDHLRPLREALAREWDISEVDFTQRVDVDVLWRGRAFQPSGTRGPDAIELELAGLPEGASREDVHRVLADQEAADREAMMATVRAELAGYGGEIQWHRLALPTGESRKDATCTLPVRVLVDRYTPKVVTDSSEGEEVKAEAGA